MSQLDPDNIQKRTEIIDEVNELFKYISGTSASRKTLCGLYAGFSLSSLIFLVSVSQNLDAFQSNGITILLISGFFFFIIASRMFYKIEENAFRIKMSTKNSKEKLQYLSDLDKKSKIASRLLFIGQIVLLSCAVFFGLAFYIATRTR